FMSSEDYFWNTGFFMFKAEVYLSALEDCQPRIFNTCTKAYNSLERDGIFFRPNKEVYADCPADSIDYAVLEKSHNVVVAPLYTAWSDIGSWSSVWQESAKDSSDNAGHGDVVMHDTSRSLVRASSRFVVTL